MKAYRLSLQKSSSLFYSLPEQIILNGYWEGSVNYIEGKGNRCCAPGDQQNGTSCQGSCDNKLGGVSVAHVFNFYKNSPNLFFDPYAEGGIGVSYFNKRVICERRLGLNTLFEIKLGVGIRFGMCSEYDIGYRYLHYSNAYLKRPNDGINLHFIMVNYWF